MDHETGKFFKRLPNFVMAKVPWKGGFSLERMSLSNIPTVDIRCCFACDGLVLMPPQ